MMFCTFLTLPQTFSKILLHPTASYSWCWKEGLLVFNMGQKGQRREEAISGNWAMVGTDGSAKCLLCRNQQKYWLEGEDSDFQSTWVPNGSSLDITERSQKAIRFENIWFILLLTGIRILELSVRLMVPNCIPQTSKILGTAEVTNFLLCYAKIFKKLIITII